MKTIKPNGLGSANVRANMPNVASMYASGNLSGGDKGVKLKSFPLKKLK